MKQLLLFLVLVQVCHPQWVTQPLPTQSHVILGVSLDENGFAAAATGWGFGPIGDISGRAYYSTNSGTEWNAAILPDSARVIVDIEKVFPSPVLFGSGARNITVSKNSFFDIRVEIKEAEAKRNIAKLNDLRLGKSIMTDELYEGAFFKSTDFGATWDYFGSLPDSITYLKKMAAHIYFESIYICASMNGGDRMIVSTDTGKTWQFSTPVIPGLTLNDVALDGLGSVFVSGHIGDTSATTGVLLVRRYNDSAWSIFQIEGTATFSTVAADFFGIVVKAGGAGLSPDTLNAVVYQYYISNGSGNWVNRNFAGAGKVINRMKYLYAPFSSMSIILADTMTSSGLKPLIMKNTRDFSGWETSQYFENDSILFLYEADIPSNQSVLVGGMSANNGLVLYNSFLELPIELTSFTASQIGSNMQLKWTTASETNNHGFTVERSTDLHQYYSIGFVKGAGSTQVPQEYIYTDSPDEPGTYHYRLKQTDFNGTYKYSDVITAAFSENIQEYILEQNYPNPFNPSTRIKFSIPQQNDNKPQLVTLTLYDILGNEIAILINEEKASGTYEVDFTAKDGSLSAGVYVYRLRAGTYSETKTMILLK